MSDERESLTLKWGSLKGWNFKHEKTIAAAQKFADLGMAWGAAQQIMTPEHKQALCDLIDVIDCDEIYLDWDGKYVSKDEAKKYVMESNPS